MAPAERLFPLHEVVKLLLQRPVHYVVVVAAAAPTDSWRTEAGAAVQLQHVGADATERQQLAVDGLLSALAPEPPAAPKAEKGGGSTPRAWHVEGEAGKAGST